jgi:hypothetical protein
MLDINETPHQQTLSDGFVLRTAANEQDVERVSQFNGVIHGHGIIAMTRNIFMLHPDTRGRDLIYIEDTRTSEVVSSLCVIPWKLSYGGVALNSGEMGIVGTLKEYRNRGLIREQVKFFKQRLNERGCVMSHIQGIAYYYRQFGYEYAMPLEGGYTITTREIPGMTAPEYRLRLAIRDDLATLVSLADKAGDDLNIHSIRNEAVWQYLMTHSPGTEMESEVWVVENTAGKTVAYVRLPKHHFGEELTVSEASQMNFGEALAVLRHVTALAVERHTTGVRLCLPATHTLMRVAKSFGARDIGTYAWQIHIPDIANLLRTIAPALERRVADSPFAGFTSDLSLHFYRQTVLLRFVEGSLVEVIDRGNTDGAPNHFPLRSFTPLALGYRSLVETLVAYPDAGVSSENRLLIETLFPKAQAFLYTIY